MREGESDSPSRPASPCESQGAGPYLIGVQVDESVGARVDTGSLETAVCRTLHAEGIHNPVEVSLLVTSDRGIQELNRMYLGEDRPTDVLAFSQREEKEGYAFPRVEEEEASYLGDIVVSYDTAAEQAAEHGHSTRQELALLAVHGTLHLLGYDDTKEPDRSRMWEKQSEIMESFLEGPE